MEVNIEGKLEENLMESGKDFKLCWRFGFQQVTILNIHPELKRDGLNEGCPNFL